MQFTSEVIHRSFISAAAFLFAASFAAQAVTVNAQYQRLESGQLILFPPRTGGQL
ncbi:MAG: hypothetical protein ACL93V_03110 [Candidatus Electrothrix sp. YB6]